MAFTATLKKTDVVGTTIVQIYDVVFTAVTAGYIKTGLSNCLYVARNNETTTAAGKAKLNRDSADSVAEQGGIYLGGWTSGDVGTVIVYGN